MKAATNLCFLAFSAMALLSASTVDVGGADCFSELVHRLPGSGSMPALHNVKLDGVAEGGELVLLEMQNASARYVRIETQAGEPAEIVIARMAAAINEVSPFNSYLAEKGRRNERGEIMRGAAQVPLVEVEGNRLQPFGSDPGSYVFAGTETGLGIPPPPTSLTVHYDAELEVISLFWENPEPPYDGVAISHGGYQGAITTMSMRVRPPAKQEVPPGLIAPHRVRANKSLRRFHVIGCRNGVLSNAGVITFNYQDNSQEELDTLPFTGGVAPNWKAWSSGSEKQAILLSQGTKGEWKRFDQEPRAAVEPDDRTFYQVIKSRSPEGVGGVYRKFLALKPGHTYRLCTRMNTFEMDNVQGDWAFTFHAVAHGSGITLSPEQMAGITPLPDGESGPDAGLVAAFGPGATTRGKFVECSTGARGSHSTAADITLPDGAEVITVWFKYHGPPSAGGVGFDWIKLKDISAQ